MSKFRNQAARNLKSAGWSAAKFTGRNADKAAAGLGRWMITDHSGMGKAMDNMPPSLGFFGTIRYMLMFLLVATLYYCLGAIVLFLMIAYGIPFLIMGHL